MMNLETLKLVVEIRLQNYYFSSSEIKNNFVGDLEKFLQLPMYNIHHISDPKDLGCFRKD